MAAQRPDGPWGAAITPLVEDAIDGQRLFDHLGWMTTAGCNGAVLFGSTGEAASFTVEERMATLDELVARGFDTGKLIVGTGCCATPDSIRLSRHAVDHGCAGILVIPPYFFKPVSEDGLFTAYSRLIEGVGSADLRVYLYHFPDLSGIPVSHALIRRLLDAYPDTVAGLKDSNGDIDQTFGFIDAFPGLDVFTGDDDLLWPIARAGGAGSVTATANIIPGLLGDIWCALQKGDESPPAAHDLAGEIWQLILQNYPITESLKECIAHKLGDAEWRNVREPFVNMAPTDVARLFMRLDVLGFSLEQ